MLSCVHMFVESDQREGSDDHLSLLSLMEELLQEARHSFSVLPFRTERVKVRKESSVKETEKEKERE